MPDDVDDLRKLFSHEDGDDNNGEPDAPDDQALPASADKQKDGPPSQEPGTPEAEDKWAGKRFADSEQPEEDDKAIDSAQEGAGAQRAPEEDFLLDDYQKRDDEPPQASKPERPSSKTAFEMMAIENLRRRKLEKQREQEAEQEEDAIDGGAGDIPGWADGVARKESDTTREDIQDDVLREKASMQPPSTSQPPVSPDESPTIQTRSPLSNESFAREEMPPPAEPTVPRIEGTPHVPEVEQRDVDLIRADYGEAVSDGAYVEKPEAAYPDDTRAQGGEEPSAAGEPAPSAEPPAAGRPPSLPDMQDTAADQEVAQLRDLVFKPQADEETHRRRKRGPDYTEPTVSRNPLLNFIGLVGAICLGIALLMSLFGIHAGVGMTGLSGIGALMIVVYGIGNRRNLKLILSARSTKYGTNVAMVLISLLAVLIVANAIGYSHYYVYDLTSERLNTLSDQTLQVLKDIRASGEKVHATVFVPREAEFRNISDGLEDTLSKYAYNLPNLEITFLDPDVNRQRAEELSFEEPAGVVFEIEDKHEKAIDFDPKSPWTYEGAMTAALLRLTGTQTKRIYFLTGHYELSTEDFSKYSRNGLGLLAQELEHAGYQVERLSFATMAVVPADCNLLFIAGPTKLLMPQEIAAVKSYIDTGGKVILLLEAREDAGFAPVLQEFGIHYRADLIADRENNLYGSNNLYPVLLLNEHEINIPITNKNMEVVFFKASGLDVDPEAKQGWFLDRLLSTKGGGSWSESGQGESVEMDPEEARGPFTMAVLAGKRAAAEAPAPGNGADAATSGGEYERWGLLLAAGDASFVANPNLNTQGNKDFILNAVNYMTSDEAYLTTRPMALRPLLKLTKGQVNIAFLVSTVLVPLLIAALGLTVWLRRK